MISLSRKTLRPVSNPVAVLDTIFQALLVVGLITVTATAMTAPKKRLMGYYASWVKNQTPSYGVDQIPFRRLTHILHAFLLLDQKNDGSLEIRPDLNDPELIRRAHAAGVKILISVGGAGAAQNEAFHKVAGDPALRAKLIENLVEFVRSRGYDGIDIDWEYPQAPDDTDGCTKLMQGLRRRMPEGKSLLSMAIPETTKHNGSGLDMPRIVPLLDFINVMSYDFHGTWSRHAGHNSPLFQSPLDPDQEGSIASSIDYYVRDLGVAPDKINAGTAFYGDEFDNVDELWSACECKTNAFSRNYAIYIKPKLNDPAWRVLMDDASGVPFMKRIGTEAGHGIIITYDDPKSTAAKVKYALGERKLGGVFMWRLGGDYDGKTQDLFDAMYNAFLIYHRN